MTPVSHQDGAGAVVADAVDAGADRDRLHHLHQRVEGDHRADQRHRAGGGAEVAADPRSSSRSLY